MKTRPTALEELRAEKAKLRAECELEKERLIYNLGYTKDNIGKLTVNSLLSSTQNGITDILSIFTGDKKSSKSKPSVIGQAASTAAPLLWELLQPILLGFALKKLKSAFKRKPKKKKS